MKHTFTITDAKAIPQVGGHKDVLAQINWIIEFEKDGFTSIGAGETMFDVSAIKSFVPLDQVSKEQVVAWLVAKEGGDAFIEMLAGIHGKMIAAKALDAQSVPASLPFIEAPAPQQNRQISYNIEALS